MVSSDAIISASAKFPKPAERTFQYGTAGVSDPSSHRYLMLIWLAVSHESVGAASKFIS